MELSGLPGFTLPLLCAILAGGLKHIDFALPGGEGLNKLTPKMLEALPEASRLAVASLYGHAFTPLFLTACGIACIGLCAAIMLKPVRLPVHGEKKA